jgi:hypothetical protein
MADFKYLVQAYVSVLHISEDAGQKNFGSNSFGGRRNYTPA